MLRLSALLVLCGSFIATCNAGCDSKGVPIGKLKGKGLKGDVFVVNSTTIQITGFSINVAPGQVPYFWIDAPEPSGKLVQVFQRSDSEDLLKPIAPELVSMKNQHIVINIPDGVNSHKTLAVSDGEKSLGSVNIPEALQPPKAQQLSVGLKGWLYKVGSGPMTIQDAKTIFIPNFSFQGNKPPDGWIFAGKLGPDGKVHGENGKKALVVGHDNKANHSPLTELYDGSKTIVAILGEDQTVCDIDFIGVYCYAVGVDFGHTELSGLIDPNTLPPYVPPIAP